MTVYQKIMEEVLAVIRRGAAEHEIHEPYLVGAVLAGIGCYLADMGYGQPVISDLALQGAACPDGKHDLLEDATDVMVGAEAEAA